MQRTIITMFELRQNLSLRSAPGGFFLPLKTLEPDVLPNGQKLYLQAAKCLDLTDPPCPAFSAGAVHDVTEAMTYLSFEKMTIPLPLIDGTTSDVDFMVPVLLPNPFFNQAHRYH